MSIVRKVRSVEKLFSKTDQDIIRFHAASGLHCLAGCGACCTKPDIEATALEFLPFAYRSFKEGKAHALLDKLKEHGSTICLLYAPSSPDKKSGKCSQYVFRGLICRLFGFSAMKDKHGQPSLVTCSRIKENQKTEYANAINMLKAGSSVPVMSNYYSRLMQIDLELGAKFYPINEALRRAVESVLHYYAYRKPPKILRKSVQVKSMDLTRKNNVSGF